jgi:hypothetical protein
MYYVTKLMAFHDAHELNFLERPALSRGSDRFEDRFDVFMDDVTYWTTQIEIRHANRLRPISTILRLTPEVRQHLHSYIRNIREIILPLHLSEKKKDALLTKLNALGDEIDHDRTKAEAWTAFTLELASTAGQAAKDLKPVIDLSNAIGNLLGMAKRMAEDLLGLPSPPTPKRIEGPAKQLPSAPPPKTLDQDDDIPF